MSPDLMWLAGYGELGIKFTWFGVPVLVSWGILIMAAFLIFDAFHYIKGQFPFAGRVGYMTAACFAATVTIIAVCLHEISHGIMAHVLGVSITGSGISWWGAYVQISDFSKQRSSHEILIALAGPVSNLIISLLARFVVAKFGESLFENSVQYVSYINWRLMKWNLLYPLLMFDGGKVLHGMIRFIVPDEKALTVSFVCSLVLSGITFVILRRKQRYGKRNDEDLYEVTLETL